jgi:anti-sigma regulatory factor (Ser/Thr protein kinase)
MDLGTQAQSPGERGSPAWWASGYRVDVKGGNFAAPAARRVVDEFPGALEDRQRDVARLLVTELVTNSVQHAGVGADGAITLTLALMDSVFRVAVSDPGRGFAPSQGATNGRIRRGGLGLALVDACSQDWGIDDRGETTVWFEIPRQLPAAATG